MNDLIQKANACHLEAYFARVNWYAHFLPLVRHVVAEFSATLGTHDLKRPYLHVLSEDVARGYLQNQKSEIWGDSITINLGHRPLHNKAVAPVKGRVKILSEDQVSLVFSQSISGNVVALIYPPSSDVAKSQKPYYMVDFWSNPGRATNDQIKALLRLMVEADMYCSAAIFPNPKGVRILAKISAKDSILSNGGSRIWVWLCYLFRVTKVVLKLHGIGKPGAA